MRLVLRLVVVLLLLVGVVLAGGFFYVQNADLAPLAVRVIKQTTGMDVVAEGPLTVKLLPQLEIHAANVTVPSFNGTKPLFKVDNADVLVSWGNFPTIWKGVMVNELRLKNPVVYLDKPANGPANWQTAEQAEEVKEHEGKKTASRGMDSLPVVAFGLIDVSNLTLSYADAASGRKVEMKEMNISADGRDAGEAKMLIDGQVNGNTVKGDVALNFTDMKLVPVTANITAADAKLVLNGKVRDQKAYAGLVNVQTPNLKESLDKLLGAAPAQAPASAFSLNGDVDAGGEDLSLRNFSASLGSLLKANGDMALTMGDNPSAKGTFSAEGSDLKALATLAMGKDKAAKLPAAPFKVRTTLSGRDAIELKDLSAELGDLAALDGNIAVVPGKNGGLPKVDGQVRARGQNLRALAATFNGDGGNLPTLPFSASAKVSGQGTYVLEELTAQLATLAMVSGEVKVTPQPVFKAEGSLKLEGQDLATTAKAFGVKATLPSTAYNAGFTLGGTDRIEVNDLRVSLPQLVEAEGQMSFAAAAPHDLKGKLTFARLNMDALGYCAKAANPGASAAVASKDVPPASATPWSDERLPLDSLNSVTFAMDVDVKTLSCASFPTKTVRLSAVNTANQLNITNLHMDMPEGSSVDMGLTLGHKGTPTLQVTLKADKVPVQTLVRTLAEKGVVLPVSGEAKLNSQGMSTRALAENLNGSLNFSANSGRVPYTNLLGNLSSLSQLIQGQVPTQRNQGLESMVARYTVKNGVMNTDELSMKTGDLTLNGTGTINLPAWSINYTLTPQVQLENQIAIPVNIKGPLGSPNIGPDSDFTSKLAGRLATEGLKGALGLDKAEAKGIGGAVGEILGGKGLKGEGVQNLLQGLVKPKQKDEPAPAATPATAPEVQPVESTPAPAAPAEEAPITPAQ